MVSLVACLVGAFIPDAPASLSNCVLLGLLRVRARCATANTMLALRLRGFRDVHGVEAARPMILAARAKLLAAGVPAAAAAARLHMVL